MLKIGFISAHLSLKNTFFAEKSNFEALYFEYPMSDGLQKAVIEGEIDAAFLPLSHLPTERTDTKIGAAVLRHEPNMAIFISENGFDAQKSLNLAENPVVAVANIREAAQIRDYRPDIQTVFYAEDKEATQLSTADLRLYNINREKNPSNYHQIVKLDATEFVPQPAEGVFILLCAKEKTEIFTKLSALNDAKIVATSNVERQCLQIVAQNVGYEKAKNQLGVYCETDANGNYHAWACWCETDGANLRYTKLSQSTRTGLADAIVKKLNVL